MPVYLFGQPNCNIYKWNNNDSCYQACILATEAAEYQGWRLSQVGFDKAIELCPILDYAYFEKSVPYLKRGDFIPWKELIDKAVSLNPAKHLGYRGWCRYQFLRDYKGAITDIETLDSLIDYDIGRSINSDYHLTIVRALCYKAIGQKEKAIAIIENQLAQKEYRPGLYDYLHLGVLKLEAGAFEEAITCFKNQIDKNDYLAETYYYLGLAYKQLQAFSDYKKNIEKAKAYYIKGYKRADPYTEPMDKIYLSEIEKELTEAYRK
jgi:tetratricopeptide (TPR) repeat protein